MIMDDGILRKQAYRGTGCERGSREGVTVSIQGDEGERQAGVELVHFGPEKRQIGRSLRVSLNWKFEIGAQEAPEV